MVMMKQAVTIGVCDSCGALQYGSPNGEGPNGFTGQVTHTVDGEAGKPVDWFACKRSHVGPAIRAVLDDPESAMKGSDFTE